MKFCCEYGVMCIKKSIKKNDIGENKDSGLPLWGAFLLDVLAACLVLVTFAFFNHGKDYLAGKLEAAWNVVVSSREAGFSELQSDSPDEKLSAETEEVVPVPEKDSREKIPDPTPEKMPDTVPTVNPVTATETPAAHTEVVTAGETGWSRDRDETEPEQTCLPMPEIPTEVPHEESSEADPEDLDPGMSGEGHNESDSFAEEEEGAEPYRFEDMMSDEVIITDTSYSSPDIHIDIYEYGSGEGLLDTPYVIADIYVRDPHIIKTYFAGGSYESGRSDVNTNTFLSAQCGALLSINGDYYVSQADSIVLRDGVLYREPKLDYDALALYDDGTMKVYETGDLITQAQIEKAVENAWQIWSFGPSLLDCDGKPKSDLSNRSVGIESSHPRTAIGYYEPCHYCFVTVEGRLNYAHGATLADLAGLFEDLGCSAAYNLDGGGSSSMIFNGKMMGMYKSERYIPDIIYLKEPD